MCLHFVSVQICPARKADWVKEGSVWSVVRDHSNTLIGTLDRLCFVELDWIGALTYLCQMSEAENIRIIN